MNTIVSYGILLLTILTIATESYGKSFESEVRELQDSVFLSRQAFPVSSLGTATPGLLDQDIDETNSPMRQPRVDLIEKEVIADQISYGYLHGFVLAGVFALAGANISRRASLIGGGFGMALGSAGAVYAIGENQSDFDRDNLLELPMFRIMDGGRLGFATFGGALIGLGVFSPITATIAYRAVRLDAPALVHVERGQPHYGLPGVSVQVGQLSHHTLDIDVTTQFIRVRF